MRTCPLKKAARVTNDTKQPMIPTVYANLLILKIEMDQKINASDKAVKKTFANPWFSWKSYHKSDRKGSRMDSSTSAFDV